MESVFKALTCAHCGSHSNTKLLLWGVFTVFLLVLPAYCMDVKSGCDESVHFDVNDLKINSYPTAASSGSDYFRFLYVDEISSSLLVGGKNQLVKLNLTDISHQSFIKKELPVTKEKNSICKYQGKSEIYCQNHIKFIVRNSTTGSTTDFGKLFVCGTDADSPVQYSVEVNDTHISPSSSQSDRVCPNNPFDNATAVFVEKGNPGDIPALYSATLSSYRKPIILRPALFDTVGTEQSGKLENVLSKFWLNEPQFVGSFDSEDNVLFFFREIALEHTNCEKKIFSRVAKVCKKDKGGSNLLVNKWTTYQKARLNCSIPGEFPNYFDEIQAVDIFNNTVYGLFTTNLNGLSASAICAFSMDSIKASFDGQFKHQEEDNSYWLPVDESKVPRDNGKRPGQCVNDSLQLTDVVESFIRVRPLMDKAVQHKFGQPIFYKSSVQMQKLVVVREKSNAERMLFLTATNEGDVYKITSVFNTSGKTTKINSVVATKFSPLPKKEAIWDLKLYDQNVYISTDTYVRQFSVRVCHKYGKMVDLCVNDPYCKWISDGETIPWKGRCEIDNDNTYRPTDLQQFKDMYHSFIKNNTTSSTPYALRSTAVIELSEYPFTLDGKTVEWKFKKDNENSFRPIVTLNTGRHYMTPDYALVITNITSDDSGTYQALIKDTETTIFLKKIKVADSDLNQKKMFEEEWMKKFSEWCDVFEEAKQLQQNYKDKMCQL